jgi:hypothetical protein
MGRSSSHIHRLIDDLTTALAATPGEQMQRRLRYTLALLHATAESLEDLESHAIHWRSGGARANAG